MAGCCYINKLPLEVNENIISHLDATDVLSVRLVSKSISQSAVKPFIRHHITERRHVLSKRSLEALVEITSNDKYGPNVKSIVLSGALTHSNDYQFGTANQELLAKIFQNINKWDIHLSLGVSDMHVPNYISDGRLNSFYGINTANLVSSGRPAHQSPERVLRFALDCAAKTFFHNIRQLKLMVPSVSSCNCVLGHSDTHKALFNIISTQLSTVPKLGFQMHLLSCDPDRCQTFTYDCEDESVTFDDMAIGKPGRKLSAFSFVRNMILLLRQKNIRRLNITSSTINKSRWYRSDIVQPHVQSLEAINYKSVLILHRKSWTSDLRFLATLPNLKEISLKDLETYVPVMYGPEEEDLDVENDLTDTSTPHELCVTDGPRVSNALRDAADICEAKMEKMIQRSRRRYKHDYLIELRYRAREKQEKRVRRLWSRWNKLTGQTNGDNGDSDQSDEDSASNDEDHDVDSDGDLWSDYDSGDESSSWIAAAHPVADGWVADKFTWESDSDED